MLAKNKKIDKKLSGSEKFFSCDENAGKKNITNCKIEIGNVISKPA